MTENLLPGFVEWLGRKDPNEHYDWPKSEICACGQYAKEIGVGSSGWLGKREWSRLNQLARGEIGIDPWDDAPVEGWTFGKLHARAKADLETV